MTSVTAPTTRRGTFVAADPDHERAVLTMAFTALFRQFGQSVTDLVFGQIDQRLEHAGQQWLTIARNLSPVRTGELQTGLYYRVENRTLVVGGHAPYTIFVDRGTRNRMGQFFIEEALLQIGPLFGAGVEIDFVTPHIASPLLAHQGTYVVPSGSQPRPLTQAQHRHVQENLVPAARRYHRGVVKRARIRVRRIGS